MDHASTVPMMHSLVLDGGWMLAAIPILPLLASVLILFFGKRLGGFSAWTAIAAMVASFGFTTALAGEVFHGNVFALQWAWLSDTDPIWTLGLAVDGLSLAMLFVVTIVGTLVQIYSIGYMQGDSRYTRYYAYISLFCASMLGLVMADHFVLLFICWELVGVCSYLLISFWFERPAAAAAGRKAFLTTKIGDVGLLLAICFLFWIAGDLQFSSLASIRETVLHDSGAGMLSVISVLIFLGAVGKSAQMPLHVWLPDAMEGPTAVSALIHAATMVAAGVYLISRTFILFTPESLLVVFIVGLITHLIAGTIALTMTDIKRILAFSTLSQLGLMVTALGMGAVSVAMFHLYTHAFFKALLFLAAGSVIHAVHSQDLSVMGGLGKHLPSTRAVFLLAALSMGGLPFFSGFWSKDAILLAAEAYGSWVMWTLIAGAVMTSTYILRLYFRCFCGREVVPEGAHPHEAPASMQFSMWVLAVASVAAGLVGSHWVGSPFFHLLGEHHTHESLHIPLLLGSFVMVGAGAFMAWYVGLRRRPWLPAPIRPLGEAWYRLAKRKYFFDEIYGALLIRPLFRLGQFGSAVDQRVVDGVVNGAGKLTWLLGQAKGWIDHRIVDGIVNGVAWFMQVLGSSGRVLQTGRIHHYLFVLVVAVVVLCFWR